MTKLTPDLTKSKKQGLTSKQTENAKSKNNVIDKEEELNSEGTTPSQPNWEEDLETDMSSGESGDDSVEDEEMSSSNESDQTLAKALDVITQQASESSSVVLPGKIKSHEVPAVNKENLKLGDNSKTARISGNLQAKVSGNQQDEEDNLTEESGGIGQKNTVDKKDKRKRSSRVIVGRRTNTGKRLTRNLVTTTVVNVLGKMQAKSETGDTVPIPKVSPQRVRQRKAVDQARKRMGLSTKYEKLSRLLEFHRMLLKGNPFSLIDPRQVYPFFHLIPGINLPHMQPLVKLWQEKATRILYQLLLIETKCDIARIKRRTLYFSANPNLFVDTLNLKLDIGLENQASISQPNKIVKGQSHNELQNSKSAGGKKEGTENVPPRKRLCEDSVQAVHKESSSIEQVNQLDEDLF